jgi:hypothetical protein
VTVANDVVYIATMTQLYALETGALTPRPAAGTL